MTWFQRRALDHALAGLTPAQSAALLYSTPKSVEGARAAAASEVTYGAPRPLAVVLAAVGTWRRVHGAWVKDS